MATTDDAQTDLKKRARRRLVGAAALALLAVIVLPMVMDPAPRPTGDDIQVRIPSQEGENFAQRRIELPASKAAPVAPAEPVVQTPVPAPAPPAEVKPTAPAKPVEKPVAPVEKAAAPDTSETRPAASGEAARAAAILAGKPVPAPVPKPEAGAYIVQLGAYSKEESASNQAATVRKKGYKAFTERIGSTTRVRVGPYASREQAESAASQLAKAGFKGVVMSRN